MIALFCTYCLHTSVQPKGVPTVNRKLASFPFRCNFHTQKSAVERARVGSYESALVHHCVRWRAMPATAAVYAKQGGVFLFSPCGRVGHAPFQSFKTRTGIYEDGKGVGYGSPGGRCVKRRNTQKKRCTLYSYTNGV